MLWWSPDPRMVLFTDEFRLKRSLRKTIAKFIRTPVARCASTAPSAASSGLRRHAARGQDGTWIVPRWSRPTAPASHRLGAVHSVETWWDGELAGGLYGVSLGRMFFGESMFSHRTDASKIALAALVCFCRAHGVAMIDCQQAHRPPRLAGRARAARTEFERRLTPALGAGADSRLDL